MLKLENVWKVFDPGTINEKTALKGINLDIKDGEFVTVIGGNGAGKSTLLNAIAGTWPVTEGKIYIDDIDVTGMPDYKRASMIGRVFQDPMIGTASDMQLEENLALALRRGKKRGLRWGVTKEERAVFRKKLASLGLGLEDRMETTIGTLSGGQRQAVTLLMASMNAPKLLLLDEHTAALDPATASKVLDISETIVKDQKLTCLMITHNMTDAINIGDRLIMMNNGKIIVDISGAEKKKINKTELLAKFAEVAGVQEETDSVLLS